MVKSINPATGEVIAEFKPMLESQVDEVIVKAKKAQKAWQKQPKSYRIEVLKSMKTVFEGSILVVVEELTSFLDWMLSCKQTMCQTL